MPWRDPGRAGAAKQVVRAGGQSHSAPSISHPARQIRLAMERQGTAPSIGNDSLTQQEFASKRGLPMDAYGVWCDPRPSNPTGRKSHRAVPTATSVGWTARS